MALSHEIISQFAKIVNSDKKQTTETTLYGTIVDEHGHKPGDKDENGNEYVIGTNGCKYIKPDGSDQLIPLTDDNEDPAKVLENSVANINYGDRASVSLKNHTATVTGNISSPSASNKDVADIADQKIAAYDIVIAEQLQADKAYIQNLIADKASVGQLEAAEAKITELEADKASIEELNASKAEITNLKATKIDADVVEANYATIENLKATNANVNTISGNFALFQETTTGRLLAIEADIEDLDVENLDVKYANIEFTNIGEAAIKNLFSDSGIIKDLIVSDGKITGELVGVTIKGELIETGTLKADRLVVKGSDGNYYALNTDFTAMPGVTPVEEDSIHGSVLVKKSIVAEKIAVDDLVAFGATIGGFKIGDHSIYSGVKSSVDNTTRGLYMDDEGQLALGDDSNYIKYAKDENGNYKLSISAVDKLNITGRNLLLRSGTMRTTNDSSYILSYDLSEPMVAGETYTMSIHSSTATDIDSIVLYPFNGESSLYTFKPIKYDNMISYPYENSSFESNGITFTVNDDKSITLNGTCTKQTNFVISYSLNLIAGTTYILSDINNNDGNYLILRYKNENNETVRVAPSSPPFTWNENYTFTNITITAYAGETYNNITFKPLLSTENVPENPDEQVLTGTFTVPQNYSEDSLSYSNVALYVYPESKNISIYNVKLERGNTATEWSLAPEDIVGVDELNSREKVLLSSISSISQSAGEISSRVTTVEERVATNADNIKTGLENIRTDVEAKVSKEGFEVDVQEIISKTGVSTVDTGTGYKFGVDGLIINQQDHDKNITGDTYTKIDHEGMTVHNIKTVNVDNMIPYPYVNTTFTSNGVTFTDNGDGSITLNGTCTQDTVFCVNNDILLDVGTTYLLTDNSNIYGCFRLQYEYNYELDNRRKQINVNANTPFTWSEEYTFINITITAYSGETYDNITFKPILRPINAVLTANKDGVDARNLSATTYLIVGGRSRFENYNNDKGSRTGCFWIGG